MLATWYKHVPILSGQMLTSPIIIWSILVALECDMATLEVQKLKGATTIEEGKRRQGKRMCTE